MTNTETIFEQIKKGYLRDGILHLEEMYKDWIIPYIAKKIGEIEKNDLGLYSGDVKSIVALLSSLDKPLTDKEGI